MQDYMQDWALTVDRFLDHAAKWHGTAEVVTAGAEGTSRIGYAALRERANRLSGALLALGIEPGQRIATLAWNTQPHVEAWYAAMGTGMVCHTLNPRLTVEHLALMVDEAQDRLLAYGAGLEALAAELAARCPSVEVLVRLDGPQGPAADSRAVHWEYEDLLAARGRAVAWGGFGEQTPAGLCFTSGTTGAPKGVLYTHRSNYLNTMRALQADAVGLTSDDAMLVVVPMFHANGWGLPFAAPAVGARMLLPGRLADGASLAKLIAEEGATVAAGVPTVWLGLVDHLDRTGEALPSLKRVMLGGAPVAKTLMDRIAERLGVSVQTSWGMTELSPVGTLSPPGRAPVASGRAPMGLDMRLTDGDNIPLPQQRGAEGRLKVKGHSVVGRYFNAPEPATDAEGWFDTGDLAVIDEAGCLTISGRAKDLIKSGGEWINPAEIEAVIGALSAVSQAAVIGRSDPKWGERPVLVVETREGHAVDDSALVAALKGRVASWWIPDEVVRVKAMPLAATGKIDKARLRAEYGAAPR